ncbi:hypothetical protein CUTER_01610 [Corynebacterium uterequi]|uniref:Uncharacterized protein n=1 Tax=Corynebacterium uterequi TaxID=1072256 RepID=A0A0G3HEE5_9CORY|nr:hypothetical protein CUTER_01610 [Corynebacterium uterequi]
MNHYARHTHPHPETGILDPKRCTCIASVSHGWPRATRPNVSCEPLCAAGPTTFASAGNPPPQAMHVHHLRLSRLAPGHQPDRLLRTTMRGRPNRACRRRLKSSRAPSNRRPQAMHVHRLRLPRLTSSHQPELSLRKPLCTAYSPSSRAGGPLPKRCTCIVSVSRSCPRATSPNVRCEPLCAAYPPSSSAGNPPPQAMHVHRLHLPQRTSPATPSTVKSPFLRRRPWARWSVGAKVCQRGPRHGLIPGLPQHGTRFYQLTAGEGRKAGVSMVR